MLHRILLVALLAGGLTGAAVSAFQALWPAPLILAAETYENAGGAGAGHDHQAHDAAPAAHSHGDEAWAPADGLERLFWTFMANVLLGLGGSLVLAAIFSLRQTNGAAVGLIWGVAVFAAISLAPALGLPPELPGTDAAALESRQLWWAATVILTAAGLACFAFAGPAWAKALGLPLILLPHVIGAPHPETHGALAPAALQHQFVIAALLTSALFWASLGAMTGFFARKLEIGLRP
jgi:cobalt transporter subunit CbtA